MRFFKMNLKGFDNWEIESLRLFQNQDLEILLDDFVEDEQEDFFDGTFALL